MHGPTGTTEEHVLCAHTTKRLLGKVGGLAGLMGPMPYGAQQVL